MGAEKGQKLRYFNLPPNMCGGKSSPGEQPPGYSSEEEGQPDASHPPVRRTWVAGGSLHRGSVTQTGHTRESDLFPLFGTSTKNFEVQCIVLQCYAIYCGIYMAKACLLTVVKQGCQRRI